MNKLLSIIIPTKNRQSYCLAAINQILNLNLEEIEIVIQDNSDEDSLRTDILKLNSNCIIYNYHPGVLSFVDNFSEPLTFASGEYVCMIGDDDCILPNIVSEVYKAKDKNIDAIVPGLNAVYFWPSENAIVKNGGGGYLSLIDTKPIIEKLDVLKGLSELMETGGQGYQQLDLPRLYHGIVKMDCINKVHDVTGMYFDGLTPDIYMSVALSFTCRKVNRLFYPLTISGICSKSGSAASATGEHTGKLQDAPHFKGHKSYNWDCKAPEIYSVESIWAETVLHSLHNFNAETYYNKFRVDVLDSICLAKYPQFSEIIIAHANKYRISVLALQFLYQRIRIVSFIKRAFHFILRSKNDKMKYYNIENIEKASKIITLELKSRKIIDK